MAAKNTQTSSHTLCIDHFNELYFACKEVSYQWEKLATYLNIGRSVVEGIGRDGHGVDDCLQRLLTFWLNEGASTGHNPPSWKALSESLKNLDGAIAERIALEHQCGCTLCTGFLGAKRVDVLSPYYNILYLQLTDPLSVAEQLFCEGVFSRDAMERVRTSSNNAKEMLLTHLEGAISTDVRSIRVFAALLLKDSKTYRIGMSLLEETSGKDTSQRYQVDADYEEEFQDKRSELGEVFEKTQQLLEAKMISPAELMSYLGYSFPELKPGLSSCGTIPEVLDLVRSHTSLVNISILKALVKKFGLTGKEDFINNFKKSIDDFCEKMKMQHAYGQRFAESFSQCPLKSETITFVLDWDANEKYLKDLTGLFKKVFKKYSSDLKIQVIHEGNSIVVECYIPSHRQGVFARLVQESEKALTEEEVISVTIGGFVVFKQNSSKSLELVSATVRSEDENFNVVSGTEKDVIIAKANAISEQHLKCITESGCEHDLPDDLTSTSGQDFNYKERKARRAGVCLKWSSIVHQFGHINAAYSFAVEAIKCLIECYFDPPDSTGGDHYLFEAIINIAKWGCTDFLPSISKPKSETVGQKIFDLLYGNLPFIHPVIAKRLLLLLFRKRFHIINSGWLLNFDFNVANSEISFLWLLKNSLYDREVVCQLLVHGMRVCKEEIDFALTELPDEEMDVFEKLVENLQKGKANFHKHIVPEDYIRIEKFRFAAILCVKIKNAPKIEKFLEFMSSPNVTATNVNKFSTLLTSTVRSQLFKKMCIKEQTKNCSIVLESGKLNSDDELDILKAHASFLLHPQRLHLFEKIQKQSQSINAILKIVLEATHKSIHFPTKYSVVLDLLEDGCDVTHLTLAYTMGRNGTPIHGAVEMCLRAEGDTRLLSSVCNIFKEQYPEVRKFTDSNKSSPYHMLAKDSERKNTAEMCNILTAFGLIDPTLKDKHKRTALEYARMKTPGCLNAFQRAVNSWKGIDDTAVPPVKNQQKPHQKTTEKSSSVTNSTSKPEQLTQVDITLVVKHTSDKDKKLTDTESTENNFNSFGSKQTGKNLQESQKMSLDLDLPCTTKLTEENLQSPDIPYCTTDQLLQFILEKPHDYFSASNEQNVAEEDLPDEYDFESSNSEDEEYPEKSICEGHANQESTPSVSLNESGEPESFSSLPWEIFISKQAGDFLRSAKTSKKVVSNIMEKLYRIGSGERSNAICHRLIEPEHKLYETYLYRAARIIWQEDIQYSELKSCPEKGEIVYTDVVRVIWITLKHSKTQLNDVLQRIKGALSKSKNSNSGKLVLKNHVGSSYDVTSSNYRMPRFFTPADEHHHSTAPVVKSHPIPNLYGGEFSLMQYHSVAHFLSILLNEDPSKRECPIIMSQQEHRIIRLPYGKEAIILCGRSGTEKTTTCIYRMWNEFVVYWEKFFDSFREAQQKEMQQDEENYLKQIFITKSPVLCCQVKKEFDKLLKSSQKFSDVQIFDRSIFKKTEHLPTCSHKKFPLFLTSRNFLFHLDASLGGKTFFPRNQNTGELEIILDFCDYNEDVDPEKLFEDFEDKEDRVDGTETANKQHGIEVNADYFCSVIWEELSGNKCSNFDPLLVWTEIQSFIKGSISAIESEEGHLSREEYKSIGRHAAPSFSDREEDRDICYDYFEKYCKFLAGQKEKGRFCFDECDLIFNLYKRLQIHRNNKTLNWHLDHFYIDEVQDFTQAEMCLLLKCCQNPNGTFCTGDIAQSIMKGVFFRFEDLRSQFYRLAQKEVPVPKLLTLTENFRSHSGVLELAQSIVDILKKCFTNSFQDSNLPRENAVFRGPKPVLLKTDSTNELAVIMLGSVSEESMAHELGAHQAIIVRSEKDRENLPKSLKNSIVLTVLEAKGLEFNDVLLYNFFSSSKAKDQWRLLYNITDDEESSLEENVKKVLHIERLHQLRRDEKQEERLKSLSAELKHLYTAITRARMNLWIYDEGEEERKPFFYYCLIKDLARLVATDSQTADSDSLMFAAPSPDEQWSKQGDFYFNMGKWELAMKCYSKANVHHKMFLTEGYKIVQEASHPKCTKGKSKLLYEEAARLLLSADKNKHNVEYIRKAILCFQRAGCHANAATLLEKMQELQRALGEWIKAGNNTKEIELRGKLGDYSGVIRCIAANGDYGAALLKAADFEKSGETLEEDVTSQQMAWEYLRKKEGKAIDSAEALQFISEGSVRAILLRENGRHMDAAEEFLKGGYHDQAYRIFEAQGLFERGYEVAIDEEIKAKFLLYHITFLLVQSKWVRTQTIAEKVKILEKFPFRYFQARSQLLMALVERNEASLKKAIENFKNFDCLPGEVAAYCCYKYLNIPTHPYKEDLHTSKGAKEIVESIKAYETNSSCTAKQRQIYQEVLRVHDLELLDSKYFISPFLLQNNVCQLLQNLANTTTTSKTDEDGMIVLDKKEVNKVLCRYYSETSVTILKGSNYFTKEIPPKIITSQFHQEVKKQHFTTSYFNVDLKVYFRNIKNLIEFCLLANEQSIGLNDETMVTFFSSVTAFYLNIKKNNIDFLKHSRLVITYFNRLAIENLKDPEINIEGYLVSFRLLTVFNGKFHARQKVLEAIKTCEGKYNFIDKRSGQKMHVFNGWLVTGVRIAERNNVIDGVWSIYNFFLSHIAHLDSNTRREAISPCSITYILSVFSTALFSMLFFGNQANTVFLLPDMYQMLIQNFNTFNNYYLLGICLRQSQECDRRTFSQAFEQLSLFLSFLLGEDENQYNVLFTALTTDSCIKDGSALYCLILCLVLAGNLYNHYSLNPSRNENLHGKLVRIHKIVCTAKKTNHHIAIINTAINELSRARNSADIFKLILKLLEIHNQNVWLVTPMVRDGNITFELVYTVYYPNNQMRALVIMEAPDSTTDEPQATIQSPSEEIDEPQLNVEEEVLQADNNEIEKDVETVTDELIVDSFCKVCGQFGETAEDEHSSDQITVDYKSHLASAEHLQNAAEYESYCEVKEKVEQGCHDLMGKIENLTEEKHFLKLAALTSKLKQIIESLKKIDAEMIKVFEWRNGVVKLKQCYVETEGYCKEYNLLKEKHERRKTISEFKVEEIEGDILPDVTQTPKLKKTKKKKKKATNIII